MHLAWRIRGSLFTEELRAVESSKSRTWSAPGTSRQEVLGLSSAGSVTASNVRWIGDGINRVF